MAACKRGAIFRISALSSARTLRSPQVALSARSTPLLAQPAATHWPHNCRGITPSTCGAPDLIVSTQQQIHHLDQQCQAESNLTATGLHLDVVVRDKEFDLLFGKPLVVHRVRPHALTHAAFAETAELPGGLHWTPSLLRQSPLSRSCPPAARGSLLACCVGTRAGDEGTSGRQVPAGLRATRSGGFKSARARLPRLRWACPPDMRGLINPLGQRVQK